jgi:hypothetical protein
MTELKFLSSDHAHVRRAQARGFDYRRGQILPNKSFYAGMAVVIDQLDIVTVCWCESLQIRAKTAKTLFTPRSSNCRLCRHNPRVIYRMALNQYFENLNLSDRQLLLWSLSQSLCPQVPQSPYIRVWGEGPWASILGIEKPKSYSPWVHFHVDLTPANSFLEEFRQLNSHLSDLAIAKEVRYQAFLNKQTIELSTLESVLLSKTKPESCKSVIWLRDHGPTSGYKQIAEALANPCRLDKTTELGLSLIHISEPTRQIH